VTGDKAAIIALFKVCNIFLQGIQWPITTFQIASSFVKFMGFFSLSAISIKQMEQTADVTSNSPVTKCSAYSLVRCSSPNLIPTTE
jgi:hypothetical protein